MRNERSYADEDVFFVFVVCGIEHCANLTRGERSILSDSERPAFVARLRRRARTTDEVVEIFLFLIFATKYTCRVVIADLERGYSLLVRQLSRSIEVFLCLLVVRPVLGAAL